ncbi:MAG: patatin-like phospholipase family protein [Nitrospirales bacterium]
MTPRITDSRSDTAQEAWNVLDQNRRGQRGADTIGLVVQGGGMRGVYSMGALAALEEMGFSQSFDHVAGSSAGALNGAYFITGQASYGVETYIHHLTQKSFVNPLRLRKMVDIDWLVDHIGKQARPLHLQKLITARTTLHISLTGFTDGQTRYVTTREPGIDLWEAFRASAAMPILYNKSVKVGNDWYVDGSLRARVPIQRVVEHGCRYVVVILTMPHSHRINSRHAWLQSLSWPVTRRYSAALRQALFDEDTDYNRMKSDLSRGNLPFAVDARKVVVITPRMQPERFSTITTNPRHLMRCALQAREDTWHAFGKTPPANAAPFSFSL